MKRSDLKQGVKMKHPGTKQELTVELVNYKEDGDPRELVVICFTSSMRFNAEVKGNKIRIYTYMPAFGIFKSKWLRLSHFTIVDPAAPVEPKPAKKNPPSDMNDQSMYYSQCVNNK